MPPRKQSGSEPLKYGVTYEAVEGAKMNALRVTIQLNTIPHFIKMLQCGCAPKIQDPSPYESAVAAAVLMTFEENMIVFKNTKNQPIEMHYGVFHGLLVVTFTLPSSMASIRQAMMIVKKSINKKAATRAYKLLAAQNKEHKSKKEVIIDTAASILNTMVTVTIFGKLADSGANKEKIKKIVDKIKETAPKRIEDGGKGIKQITTMPHF